MFLLLVLVVSSQEIPSLDYNDYFDLFSPNGSFIEIISGNLLKFKSYGEYQVIVKSSFYGTVKLWGAGGGLCGGKGGTSNGTILFRAGKKYIVWVGQGGTTSKTGASGSFGGGGLIGKTNSGSVYLGSGGGMTGVFLESVNHSNSLIIAGGGGGGLLYGVDNVGGDGGGLIGGNGVYSSHPTYVGKGGTQTNGGSNGYNGYNSLYGSLPGSALKGGNGASSTTQVYSGASGGGGYYGGGAGNNNNYAGGPGGGGSGYIHPLLVLNGNTSSYRIDADNTDNYGFPETNGLFVISLSTSFYHISHALIKRNILTIVLSMHIIFLSVF